MYKHLMSLLTIATLACGLTFAEEENVVTKPVVEEQEQVQDPTLAFCGCGKADCGCKKTKKIIASLASYNNAMILCDNDTKKLTDEEIIEETEEGETLACDECGCEHCDKDKKDEEKTA